MIQRLFIKINLIQQKYELFEEIIDLTLLKFKNVCMVVVKEKINYTIFKEFGPSVLKVKIPEIIVTSLNNHIDEIINDSEESKKLNHGIHLVGDVTQEIKLENDFIKRIGWADFLAQASSQWIQMTINQKITKFDLMTSWVVRQFQNEYNPIHWHNGHISGAGFLKVPKSLGKHVQRGKLSKEYHGGNLQLVHGSKMFLSESIISIRPEVGDFYFFPHYMMHQVLPFKNSNEERRSISFNAKIDEEIFDVFSRK